jgi:hypothetical protein
VRQELAEPVDDAVVVVDSLVVDSLDEALVDEALVGVPTVLKLDSFEAVDAVECVDELVAVDSRLLTVLFIRLDELSCVDEPVAVDSRLPEWFVEARLERFDDPIAVDSTLLSDPVLFVEWLLADPVSDDDSLPDVDELVAVELLELLPWRVDAEVPVEAECPASRRGVVPSGRAASAPASSSSGASPSVPSTALQPNAPTAAVSSTPAVQTARLVESLITTSP